ncbi:uncharacterized protein EV420DRAFT_1650801 [Desarmillaria tabescens]|uniref:Uncharacterized protein n=1 Tax=Armillaria tabescens TaxID=1929756 RepID=A0AA39JBG0_ARMTA|nr:uncharacterized protein EV420DRAFT_1650801 [Desarmillaria tabescens]KAK0439686.1 hypothetical protein EV420DRAFT_1650801 [Desarmillaria tabescens]
MNPINATITHVLETLTSLVRYPLYRSDRSYPRDGSAPVHPITGGNHLQTQYSGNPQFATGYWEDTEGSWDNPNTPNIQQFYTDEYNQLTNARTLEEGDENVANGMKWQRTTFERIGDPFLLTRGVDQEESFRDAKPMLHTSELDRGIYSSPRTPREAWGVHIWSGVSIGGSDTKRNISSWSLNTSSLWGSEVIRLESEVASKRSAGLCSQVYQWKERGVAEEKGILDWGTVFPVDFWITPEEGSWELPPMSSNDTWLPTTGDGWESPWPDTSYEAIWPNPMAQTAIYEEPWDSLSTPILIGKEYQTAPEEGEGDETIHIFGAELQH